MPADRIAYTGNNYYPFMLQPYRAKRALLFQCLDALALKSSSPDDSVLRTMAWIRQFRSSHKEYVSRDTGIATLDLSWLGDAKWRRLIEGDNPESGLVHRKYRSCEKFRNPGRPSSRHRHVNRQRPDSAGLAAGLSAP